MIKVGLTGGIATGKSTVAGYLRKQGIPIIDADVIAREVVVVGKPALDEIRTVFGDTVINEAGELDRKALGKLVFGNRALLKKLNAITHPYVYAEMEAQAEHYRIAGEQLVILDLPLLYETNNHAGAQKVIVVVVTEEKQLERLMKRNDLSLAEAKQRVAAQMPLAQKQLLADFVVDNNGTIQSTYEQVDQILKKLLND